MYVKMCRDYVKAMSNGNIQFSRQGKLPPLQLSLAVCRVWFKLQFQAVVDDRNMYYFFIVS